MKYTENYWPQIDRLRNEIEHADAIVIGAGAGLSASAGLTYFGERFEKNFADFIAKYHYRDMYSAGFYPYGSLEEYWAYWSRHVYFNRYAEQTGAVYDNLLGLVHDKDYFVLTTNVDHCFQKSGFDKQRLFYTQGDYGLLQCSRGCHPKTYDNEETVMRMVSEQTDMRIPSSLVPHCPKCGAPMSMNLRCDNTFVEDEGWHLAAERYANFIRTCGNLRTLFLELGVGGNTPGIIKYPFWQMTAKNPNATYACVNLGEAVCPKEIASRSICVDKDISDVIQGLLEQTEWNKTIGI